MTILGRRSRARSALLTALPLLAEPSPLGGRSSRPLGFLRRALRTPRERQVYDALRLAHLAARPFREGLDERSAGSSARAIRQLLGVGAVAISDVERVLAYSGAGQRHHGERDPRMSRIAEATIRTGRSRASRAGLVCEELDCPIGETVAVPLTVGNDVVGSLIVLQFRGRRVTLGLLRATREVGRLISTQLALAEGDRTREALVQARTVALRAQISPHFAYNTLTAIASLVRREPERARELLIQFAEFSRYILRNDRINTTLADELRNVHTYLDLERARYRDRLEVVFRVDPGVLPALVPMLLLQPLVENAVQHGFERQERSGQVTILAEDRDEEVYVAVTDNGAGMSPETIARILEPSGNGERRVGLANVQDRLRVTFGERYRLRIESKAGEGTTVSFCVPKHRAGVTV
ncbi:MAG: sensor histidine kinase [Acidimicrobiia bacterium]